MKKELKRGLVLFWIYTVLIITTVSAQNCQLTNASWSTTNTIQGQTVTLTVEGTDCDSEEVNFVIWEDDSGLEFLLGGADDPVNINPASANFSGNTATTTWISEWQSDCNGFCNPPEYYYIATLVNNASNNINSKNAGNPLLEVQSTIMQGNLVPLTVKEENGVARVNDPVTSGVPFPKGALVSASNVRLLDENMNEIPAQFEVANTWYNNGSVKWLHVNFQANVAPNSEKTYYLEYGPSVSQSVFHPNEISIIDNGGTYSVDTGAAQFVIDKNNFNLFDSVIVGSDEYIDPTSNGFGVIDLSSNRLNSYDISPTSVEVELSDSMHSIIKVEGAFSYLGNPNTHYITRIHFYAGLPTVVLQHTFINKNPGPSEEEEPHEALFLNLQTTLNNPTLKIARETGYYENNLSGTQSAKILGRGYLSQDVICDDDPCNLRNYRYDEILYDIFEDTTDVDDVLRPRGSMSLSDGTGKQITVSYKDFWQQIPNKLYANASGNIEVQYYPEEREPLYWNYHGRAITFDTRIDFGVDNLNNVEILNNPLFARANSSWYANSKALGDLPAWEDVSSTFKWHLDGELDWIKTVHEDGLLTPYIDPSWIEFGGTYGIFHYGAQRRGEKPLACKVMGNHYDAPYAMQMICLLSGEKRYCDNARKITQHLEIIVHHHDDDPLLVGIMTSEDTPCSTLYYGSFEDYHNWFEGTGTAWLIYGDRRMRDIMIAGAKVNKARIDYWFINKVGCSGERPEALFIENLVLGFDILKDIDITEANNIKSTLDPYVDKVLANRVNHGIFEELNCLTKGETSYNCGGPSGPQIWMVGMLIEALQKYYELTEDPRIPSNITAVGEAFLNWTNDNIPGDIPGDDPLGTCNDKTTDQTWYYPLLYTYSYNAYNETIFGTNDGFTWFPEADTLSYTGTPPCDPVPCPYFQQPKFYTTNSFVAYVLALAWKYNQSNTEFIERALRLKDVYRQEHYYKPLGEFFKDGIRMPYFEKLYYEMYPKQTIQGVYYKNSFENYQDTLLSYVGEDSWLLHRLIDSNGYSGNSLRMVNPMTDKDFPYVGLHVTTDKFYDVPDLKIEFYFKLNQDQSSLPGSSSSSYSRIIHSRDTDYQSPVTPNKYEGREFIVWAIPNGLRISNKANGFENNNYQLNKIFVQGQWYHIVIDRQNGTLTVDDTDTINITADGQGDIGFGRRITFLWGSGHADLGLPADYSIDELTIYGGEPQTYTCSDMGGTCCSGGQECVGGSSTVANDCSLCCLFPGTCQDPPECDITNAYWTT